MRQVVEQVVTDTYENAEMSAVKDRESLGFMVTRVISVKVLTRRWQGTTDNLYEVRLEVANG